MKTKERGKLCRTELGETGSIHPGNVWPRRQPGDEPAAGWAGHSRLQRSPSRAHGALPNCHLVVPTQTVVAARGPGRNSIPQLLFTGVVWLLRKTYFLLPNFSNELHAAPCKILKGNLPVFICSQLVHDLSHRLLHIQLATDHQQVISTGGVNRIRLVRRDIELENAVNGGQKHVSWIYPHWGNLVPTFLLLLETREVCKKTSFIGWF